MPSPAPMPTSMIATLLASRPSLSQWPTPAMSGAMEPESPAATADRDGADAPDSFARSLAAAQAESTPPVADATVRSSAVPAGSGPFNERVAVAAPAGEATEPAAASAPAADAPLSRWLRTAGLAAPGTTLAGADDGAADATGSGNAGSGDGETADATLADAGLNGPAARSLPADAIGAGGGAAIEPGATGEPDPAMPDPAAPDAAADQPGALAEAAPRALHRLLTTTFGAAAVADATDTAAAQDPAAQDPATQSSAAQGPAAQSWATPGASAPLQAGQTRPQGGSGVTAGSDATGGADGDLAAALEADTTDTPALAAQPLPVAPGREPGLTQPLVTDMLTAGAAPVAVAGDRASGASPDAASARGSADGAGAGAADAGDKAQGSTTGDSGADSGTSDGKASAGAGGAAGSESAASRAAAPPRAFTALLGEFAATTGELASPAPAGGLTATGIPAVGLGTPGLGTSPAQAAAAGFQALLQRHQAGMPGMAEAAQAVGVQIRRSVAAGDTAFAIRLDPPELGRIDIRLDLATDGRVSAQVAADSPQVLDLLRRDASVLERALNDAGLRADSGALNFSLRQQTQQDAQSQGQQAATGRNIGTDAAGTPSGRTGTETVTHLAAHRWLPSGSSIQIIV